MLERVWSMVSLWGLSMALGTIAFIGAVAFRQGWLILAYGGLLLVIFAQGGISGWLGDLLFWNGLAIAGIGLWRNRRTAKPTSSL